MTCRLCLRCWVLSVVSLTLLCLPLFQVLVSVAADLSACLGFGMVEFDLEDV